MSARSRRRAAASLLGVLAILALAASPVLAKEGTVAMLDAAVHRDSQPGSTIEVRWAVVAVSNDQVTPFSASGFYVTLTGPSGSKSVATGQETPFGSGHYVAKVVVPPGGIQDISVALSGTACSGEAGCQRADMEFPLTDDFKVMGSPVGITAPATPSTATTSVSNGLLPLVLVGVAFALGGALTALVVTRRRPVAIEPTAR